MQPTEVVEYPTTSKGIPGYNPTPGVGYQALRDGHVVFVLNPRTTSEETVSAPSTSQQVMSAAPIVPTEGGLT